MIYLDSAATSNIKPKSVIDAVLNSLTNGCGNCGRGVNQAALKSSHIVQNARTIAAEFTGFPNPSCIAFTANSTEALNIAINGTVKKNQTVVTTESEHNSVLRPLFFQKNIGTKIQIAPLTTNGGIDYEALRSYLLQGADILVLTLASNVTGNLTDLSKVASILNETEAKTGRRPIFIADASQTAGAFSINASDIDGKGCKIDILCCTGHKSLFGPQGTGFIGVMPGITVAPLLRGGTGFDSFNLNQPEKMPTVLEAGTLNVHGITGLLEGIQFIKKTGLAQIRKHEMEITQQFYDGIQKINSKYQTKPITLYGDFSCGKEGNLKDRAPIVSLNIENNDSSEISDILSFDYGIATRAGAHCAPLVHKHFHTEDQGMVRFSFNWFTTAKDINAALEAIKSITDEIKK